MCYVRFLIILYAFVIYYDLRAVIFSNYLPEILNLLHQKNMLTALSAFLNTYLKSYSMLHRTVQCILGTNCTRTSK